MDPLIRAIIDGTVFGVGGAQKERLNHAVWTWTGSVTKVTRELKDEARMQLGTSRLDRAAHLDIASLRDILLELRRFFVVE